MQWLLGYKHFSKNRFTAALLPLVPNRCRPCPAAAPCGVMYAPASDEMGFTPGPRDFAISLEHEHDGALTDAGPPSTSGKRVHASSSSRSLIHGKYM